MKKARKLYESPSGDRWYLVADPSGTVFIHHEANLASGGQVEHEELAAFLSRGSGPVCFSIEYAPLSRRSLRA